MFGNLPGEQNRAHYEAWFVWWFRFGRQIWVVTSGEPFLMLLAICFAFFVSPSQGSTPLSQIQALEFLYNSTHGENWKWKNEIPYGVPWSFATPQPDPCNDQNKVWQGITCSSRPNLCQSKLCQIVSLVLYGYGLNGTLPSEFFVELTSLTFLEISGSPTLIGTIPTTASSLRNLEDLQFYRTHLTGPIPSSLISLSHLVSLKLYSNRLTGSLYSSFNSLPHLSYLSLHHNQLTGTIPSSLCSMTQLNFFYLHKNRFIGTIPSSISSLSRLVSLNWCSNNLTGTFPAEIGSFPHLNNLAFNDNQLTGTIPSTIGSLSQLTYLGLYRNQLTGVIPSTVGSLTALEYLSLYLNQLTGTIPSSLGSMLALSCLYLDDNHLTGIIPSSIASLSQLVILYLYGNQLTGPISVINFLPHLEFLLLDDNRLSGSLPSSIPSTIQLFSLKNNQLTGSIPSTIGALSRLESLYLSQNELTGTVPQSLDNLTNMTWCHLHQNQLKGSISFQLSSLPLLQQLFLQQNRFTGHLSELFLSSSVTRNLSSSRLLNLDMSDNMFSGSIPSDLFLPQLQSISLSLNCFRNEIPSTICEATDAVVISMDGLGSAKNCKGVVILPLASMTHVSVSLVQNMVGTIPDCIWAMSNLKMLNLAGNGLHGRIGNASAMSSLLSLTLSHNYLNGVIPLWLQRKNISHVDLSHNKLTGDVNGFMKQHNFHLTVNTELANTTFGSQYDEQSLKLTVNRLSGELTDASRRYGKLDILSGNLFGCDYLPSNDQNVEWWSCGSEEYDQSMSLLGGVLGVMVLSMICYCLFVCVLRTLNWSNQLQDYQSVWLQKRLDDLHTLVRNAGYFRNFPSQSESESDPLFVHQDSPNQSTLLFGSLLSNLMKSMCVLLLLSVLLSLPVYILKELDVGSENETREEPEYVTHTHLYSWLWTMAFLSGNIPAMILLCLTFVCLIYFMFVINRLGSGLQSLLDDRVPSQRLESMSPHSTPPGNHKDHTLIATVWMVFLLNLAVVGTVNGLYVASTLQDISSDLRIWIQLSFGLFSSLWSSLVLENILSFQIKESKYGVWLFVCLNLVNSVLIPCLATALSSPSCYQVSYS
jgi:Leucine-rich repeat (LRR) protein